MVRARQNQQNRQREDSNQTAYQHLRCAREETLYLFISHCIPQVSIKIWPRGYKI